MADEPKTATSLKKLSVGNGVLIPANWSRDGRWLSGEVFLPSASWLGNALYDVAADTVRALSDDGSHEIAWMPGYTRVLYFTKSSRSLMIQDIASLKRHEVAVKLPFPPDDYRSLTASPDGRTFYYGAQQVEANIWKVEQPKTANK